MVNLTIGLDPEFVVMTPEGKPISAPNVFKVSGRRIPKVRTRDAIIFPDNANLEMSINPGATKSEFLSNIKSAISQAHQIINPNGEGYTLHAIPALDYPEQELNHPICKVFGCEPDYDAFEVRMNDFDSISSAKQTLRTCGGHVHIGTEPGSKYEHLLEHEGAIQQVKMFELFVGASGVLLDNNKESIRRRSLYGKAGAHRPKPYGVECRSQSNYWLNAPELCSYMYDMVNVAVNATQEGILEFNHWSNLQKAINEGNQESCKSFFGEASDFYPEAYAIYEEVEYLTNLDTKIAMKENWGI